MTKTRFLVQVVLSILCLVAGSLVAVSLKGVYYGVSAGLGFGGYLFFFSRALRALPLPRVILEGGGGPDPERKQFDDIHAASAPTQHLTAA